MLNHKLTQNNFSVESYEIMEQLRIQDGYKHGCHVMIAASMAVMSFYGAKKSRAVLPI